MPSDDALEVNGLALNVTIPEHLRWNDVRRGEEFRLTSLTVRLLKDGTLAAKAYGRPVAGGRGAYVSFSVPDDPALRDLMEQAAAEAARLWTARP
ncbi:SIMPL domain-containing protein [Microbacterium sp. gxy059]|uniref:SIMPL domain-containing protein n=1 Tax=Microbacterium sp. gxy059 TaxID=2957199 RepID=UPI003D9527EC